MPSVRETIGMNEPRAYRNKMALVVDQRRDPPALGFYRQRTHDVVPIDACPIVTPQLDAPISRGFDALRAHGAGMRRCCATRAICRAQRRARAERAF